MNTQGAKASFYIQQLSKSTLVGGSGGVLLCPGPAFLAHTFDTPIILHVYKSLLAITNQNVWSHYPLRSGAPLELLVASHEFNKS